MAGGRVGRRRLTTGERQARSRGRSRADQRPPRRRSPAHHLAPPHQGWRPHPDPLHQVAPPLPLRPAQPRRRSPPRRRARPLQPRLPHSRRPPGALPPALPYLGFLAVNLMNVVRAVKVLVLRISPPSVDDAIDFVTFFPCLEKLYVLLYRTGASKRARHSFPLGYIECLELHLKKVVLINYQGTPRDVDFARYFLLNAKVLEHMEFASRTAINRKKYISEWRAGQHRKLQLDNRVSQGAQFNFSCDSYYGDEIHIGHIHDLTISDPFDRSSCRCHDVDFL
ncbi:unnamed protein product [Triticum turgidum subsp. durum]|uniref:FBD domain-containing protein n=1 Tax=Triticum turgidum subsp. durum TaxID=4567 RepID=A0A9R0ZLF0_TRITD|nr:unnamed protein product [Triticum turgidum subsp. durum]